MKKRTISLLCAIFLLFNIAFNVSAADRASTNSKYRDVAVEFATQISKNTSLFSDWKSITLSDGLYLYDETGNSITAISYEVYLNGVDAGYIIVDYNTLKVIELSRNASPYGKLLDLYKKKKGLSSVISEYCVYSPGVHAYAAKKAGNNKYEVYDFVNDRSVSISLPQTETLTSNQLSSALISPLSTGVHSKIISGVLDSTYTISCIPTAIGNVVWYWDTHGYPNLIVSPYTIYDSISEINTKLIAACGSNTNNSGIPAATQNYCRATGRYPNNFNVTNIWSPSYSTYKTEITNNRPPLVGFAAGGPYTNAHMTTGVGYYYDDAFPNDKYIYVHDAWSTTAVDYMVLWGSYNDFIAKIVP